MLKAWGFALDLLLCALSFPKALISDPIPTISSEAPTSYGGWLHRRKNRAVETVRDDAQWFTKFFSIVILLQLGGLVWLTLFR